MLQHAGTAATESSPAHTVKADLTLTFAAPKLGFSQPHAWPYLGKFEVADISTPPELLAQITGP